MVKTIKQGVYTSPTTLTKNKKKKNKDKDIEDDESHRHRHRHRHRHNYEGKEKGKNVVMKRRSSSGVDMKAMKEQDGCLRLVTLRMKMHLLPSYLGDFEHGVCDTLNGYLMKHLSAVDGALLSYWGVQFLQRSGRILSDSPHVHFVVNANALVFTPRTGDRLVGVVQHIGPDYLGLLVYGAFNASLSREAIREQFQCDGSLQFWYDTAHDNVRIEVNTHLDFIVRGVHVANGVLSLSGAMLSGDTGLHPPVHHVTGLDACENGERVYNDAGVPAVLPSSSNTDHDKTGKKRRLEPCVTGGEDEEPSVKKKRKSNNY